MNVMIIDDFKPIVDTIYQNVDWKRIKVNTVYQACSAREAKLLLTNFPIDILLCDIEMPEESGLELFSWAKIHFPEIECIFLTSHAEFSYAVEAMKLGSFDYVLQPAKFEDIEDAVIRVSEKINMQKRYQKLEAASAVVSDECDSILELMQSKRNQKKYDEADEICKKFLDLHTQVVGCEECEVRELYIRIEKWARLIQKEFPDEIQITLKKTLTFLFEEEKALIAIAAISEKCFWVNVISERGDITNLLWQQKVKELISFIQDNLCMQISVFSVNESLTENFTRTFNNIAEEAEKMQNASGFFISESSIISISASLHPSIEAAIEYIKKNINKDVTRAEVANAVNISDEYFSRLFRKETGETYKDYIVSLKMETAKKMLGETSFSVGIIASKVGYSNFSHFSKSFREYTGFTPMDYKKHLQDKQ